MTIELPVNITQGRRRLIMREDEKGNFEICYQTLIGEKDTEKVWTVKGFIGISEDRNYTETIFLFLAKHFECLDHINMVHPKYKE